jgi:hypothetical protein
VTVTIALALGAVIGVVLGLLGGGGSILAVPALVYGVGLDLKQAIPVSLIVVGIAAAVGAVPNCVPAKSNGASLRSSPPRAYRPPSSVAWWDDCCRRPA